MRTCTVISSNIHRLTMSYKDIFTTVYLLRAPGGCILFDAGSFDEDITGQLLPYLASQGITGETLKYVFISHNHRDHSGGLPRLLEAFPDTCIVSRSSTLRQTYAGSAFLCPEDGQLLLDTFRVVSIPGHTADSAALLDLRTMTLITGDCLQLFGIRGSGDWACNISYPTEHLAAIKKLRTMGIESVLTAHDYVPYGFHAQGKAQVAQMLDACVTPLRQLKQLILEQPEADDARIRELFRDPEGPLTVNVRVVAAIRAALVQGELAQL